MLINRLPNIIKTWFVYFTNLFADRKIPKQFPSDQLVILSKKIDVKQKQNRPGLPHVFQASLDWALQIILNFNRSPNGHFNRLGPPCNDCMPIRHYSSLFKKWKRKKKEISTTITADPVFGFVRNDGSQLNAIWWFPYWKFPFRCHFLG